MDKKTPSFAKVFFCWRFLGKKKRHRETDVLGTFSKLDAYLPEIRGARKVLKGFNGLLKREYFIYSWP